MTFHAGHEGVDPRKRAQERRRVIRPGQARSPREHAPER
jgi:hypothetical protein